MHAKVKITEEIREFAKALDMMPAEYIAKMLAKDAALQECFEGWKKANGK